MSATFFGNPERPLFGYHHAPRGAPTAAALICAPWGSEYQYAHRALRVLGKRLAERGVHALRFDYSGTGDSAGETSDTTLEQCVADTIDAAAELRRASGVRRVDLIGLRIGAAVAARAAARDTVRRIVLWDPVADGSAWIGEVGAPRALRTGPGAGGDQLEFGASVVSRDLLAGVSTIDHSIYAQLPADSVLWLDTQTAPPDAPISPGAIERRHVPDVAPWSADTSIWSGQVPASALRTLVEWITA